MLTLYKFGNSICTQKVLVTLAEKRLAFETVNVDLFKNEQYAPAYLKLNPKAVVPTLVHDGRAITESTLICEYLDEVFPEPRLVPADPFKRAKMRAWSKTVDEGIFTATRELSFSAMFREKLRRSTPEQRERRFKNVGDPDRRARFESSFEHGVDSPYVFQGIAAFERLFAAMEHDLAAGGPWLVGGDLTLADIAIMPMVARLDYLTLLDIWLGERPHVARWWRRGAAHPTFAAAIRDHVSEAEMTEMRTAGATIHAAVRARRDDYLRDYAPAAA